VQKKNISGLPISFIFPITPFKSSRFARSAAIYKGLFPVSSSILFCAFLRFSSVLERRITSAPAFASTFATPKPIPFEEAVTKASFPLSFISIVSPPFRNILFELIYNLPE